MNIEGVWGGVGGGVDKIEMLSDVWGWGGGVRECFRCPILIFILKKIGFVP